MSDDRPRTPADGDPAERPATERASERATPSTERTTSVAGPPRTPVTQQIGRIVSLAIAVLFGIFAVSNAQHVDFNWVFGGTEVVEQAGERVSGGVRLIVLMVASFLSGLVVATVDAWRRTRRRKRVPPTGEA